MFVVISQFTVANGMEEEVREAFRRRPHLVDQAPGFLRMEVVSPREEPASFWLLTWWTSEEHFQSWHRGHKYAESHAGIPRGLKLVPGRNRVLLFDHVAT